MKTMKDSKVTNDSILKAAHKVNPLSWYNLREEGENDRYLKFARLVLKQQKQDIINMLAGLEIEGSSSYGELCAAAVEEMK
jgi:hypothetical protein